jgi:hypothetical protein
MDLFTLFGVPFVRPPDRVPLGGLGGDCRAGRSGDRERTERSGCSQGEAGQALDTGCHIPYLATTLP